MYIQAPWASPSLRAWLWSLLVGPWTAHEVEVKKDTVAAKNPPV